MAPARMLIEISVARKEEEIVIALDIKCWLVLNVTTTLAGIKCHSSSEIKRG
jgi:hypothetical protein